MVYLATAFTVVWAAVLLYVLYLGQRQRILEQELDTLDEMIVESTRKKGT